jgi:hypothetical protein
MCDSSALKSGSVDTFASQKRALDELWNELLVAVSLSGPLTLIMWTGPLLLITIS